MEENEVMEKEEFVCESCGRVCDEDEIVGEFCTECSFTCPDCHKTVSSDDSVTVMQRGRFGGYSQVEVCLTCSDDHYTECYECNEFFRTDEMLMTHDGYSICNRCFSNYFHRCDDCDEIFRESEISFMNGNAYCSAHVPNRSIREYHDTPPFNFHRCATVECEDNLLKNFHDNFFMGLEVEMANDDLSDSQHQNVAEKLDAAMGEDNMFFCYDGSVDGFECITHPAQIGYLKTDMDWDRFFKIYHDYDYNTSGCGLHIHVSRAGLGRDKTEQDFNILKIIYFMEKFWNKVVKFSRRDECEIDRWAKRYNFNPETENMDSLREKTINEPWHDRYHSVNLTKRPTIEFRIFNGVDNKKDLFAAIDFVYWLCYNCLKTDVADISEKKFMDFFEGIDESFKEYCDYNGVLNKEVWEMVADFVENNEFHKLNIVRRSRRAHIVMVGREYAYSLTPQEFIDKFGKEKLVAFIKAKYNHDLIFPNIGGSILLTPRRDIENNIARSFDGTPFSCHTQFYEYVIDGKIEVHLIQDDGCDLVGYVKSNGKFTYLRKYEETRIYAELFYNI